MMMELVTMSDINDKPLQKALEILEAAALTHDDFTASDTCAAAFATVKARIESDAKVIEAARMALDILDDSWGDDRMPMDDDQAANLLRDALTAREDVK